MKMFGLHISGVSVYAELVEIRRMQSLLLKQQGYIMHTLDETLAEVTAEKTMIAGLQTTIDGLRQQVAAATAGALSADQQAKVDAIFDAASANSAALTAALTANTTTTPSPAPAAAPTTPVPAPPADPSPAATAPTPSAAPATTTAASAAT